MHLKMLRVNILSVVRKFEMLNVFNIEIDESQTDLTL